MKVLIIGSGTIGLPLGLSLAKYHQVTFIDSNPNRIEFLRRTDFSFPYEPGILELKIITKETVRFLNPRELNQETFEVVVFTVNLSSKQSDAIELYKMYENYCQAAGSILFRSTLNNNQWNELSQFVDLKKFAYVPERSRPGNILKELASLPQVLGHEDPEAFAKGYEILKEVVPEVLSTTIIEAIAVKLLSNSWRAAVFDLANNFFIHCHQSDLDFIKISKLAKKNYPRLDSLPLPGFISGPCLPKDYESWRFWGKEHAPIPLNDKLLQLIVKKLLIKFEDVSSLKISLIGKGYRVDYPDERESIAHKLKPVLEGLGATVAIVENNHEIDPVTCNLTIHLFPGGTKNQNIKDLDFWGKQ